MAHLTPRSLSGPARPILDTFDRNSDGYRFRFSYGARTLILDTDHSGRALNSHLEWPPEFTVPPIAVETALEQVRRILLGRRFHNG